MKRYEEYKDSGIAWIGEIPAHWEVKRLKNVCALKTGTTPTGFDKININEQEINWYTPSDICDDCNVVYSSERKLSKDIINKENISLYPSGSLIMVGIGALAGKIAYIEVEGYSNQQITALITSIGVSKYYFYYLIADRKRIRDNAFFTTLPIINNSYLSQNIIVFPPIGEQEEIAEYLDRKCGEVDELVGLQEQMIAELRDLWCLDAQLFQSCRSC